MKIIKSLSKNKTFILIIADIFLIAIAIYFSFFLRFDWRIPLEKRELILPSILLAIAVTIPSFFFQKIYKTSWSYVSLNDVPKFLRSVFISTVFFGIGFYLLRSYSFFEGFPRSVIILYGILLFILVISLRFSKRIYWQIIKGDLSSERKWERMINTEKGPKDKINSVLVTGGAGYIGSIFVRKLLEKKYKVKAVDKLLFGKESIEDIIGSDNFDFIEADVNTDDSKILKILGEIDAVVHLAAIVGDPACAAQPEIAMQTNYKTTVKIARFCKEKGIKKFIFTSTCSNYGSGEKELLRETSHLKPVSLYAESKIYAEKELIRMTDDNFKPLIFRLSTVYGLSPRMRFDLVINLLTKKAWKDKEITIFGGEQWRPFIHVQDVVTALMKAIETPYNKIHGQIFNVGSTKENYKIKQIGETIKEVMPEVLVKQIENSSDDRDYNVSFEKIKNVFGYNPQHTVKKEIKKMYKVLNENKFPDPENPKYYNYVPEQ